MPIALRLALSALALQLGGTLCLALELLPTDVHLSFPFGVDTKGLVVAEKISVDGQEFSQAQQVRLVSMPKSFYDARDALLLTKAIPRDGILTWRGFLRCPDAAPGKVQVEVIKTVAPYDRLLLLNREVYEIGEDWQEFTASGPIDADYPPGQYVLGFLFGHHLQTIEVGPMRLTWERNPKAKLAKYPGKFLPEDAHKRLDFSSIIADSVTASNVATTGKGFTTARRIEIGKPAKNDWDIEARLPLGKMIKKGELVRMRYWCRSPDDKPGLVTFQLRSNQEDDQRVVQGRNEVTKQWQQFVASGTALKDFPVGTLDLRIFVGDHPQVIEIGPITVELFKG